MLKIIILAETPTVPDQNRQNLIRRGKMTGLSEKIDTFVLTGLMK